MLSFRESGGEQAGIFTWSILSMFEKRRLSLAAAVPLLLLFFLPPGAGCSKILKQNFREPKVRVLSLSFNQGPSPESPSTIPLTVTLEVTNPNTFALKAKYLTYTVRSREETLASGEKSEFTEILPGATAVIDVPVTVSIDSIIRTVKLAAKKLDISVTAFGSVTLASFLGDVNIPFKKEFKKNLRQLIFP